MKKSHISILVFLLQITILTSCVKRSERPTLKERRMARHTQNALLELGESFKLDFLSKPFEISYVSQGRLKFHDLNSSETLQLPEEKHVFNFAFSEDRTSLFYTVEENDSLYLKKAFFKDTLVYITELSPLKEPVRYFKTQTYDEKGNMFVLGDTVFLECNYIWEAKGFTSSLNCIVSDEYVQLNIEMIAGRMMNEMKNLMKDEDAKFMKSVMEVKMHGFTDFYLMSNNKPIKLTDIKLLFENSQNEIEDDLNTDILREVNMWVSPDSSKLLYSSPTSWGDMIHGPYELINVSGENKIQLGPDVIAMKIKPVWLDDGHNIIWLRDRDGNHKVYDLCMTVDETNTPVVIADDVDYYLLR